MIGPRVGIWGGERVGPAAGTGADPLIVFKTQLTVSIADSIDPVINNANFSYAVTVSANSVAAALAVVVDVTLDATLTFVSGSGAGWRFSQAGQVITCRRNSIVAGGSSIITINVTTGSGTGAIVTTADASANNAAPATQDSETTTVELVSFDAGAQRRVPADATEWGRLRTFFGLTMATPDNLWLMQEAAANLADSIGALTLTAVTSPLYNQSAGTWARLGVAGDDNTNDRFGAALGVGPDPTTTSQFWLALVRMGTAIAGSRRVMGINNTTGANSVRLQLSLSQRITTQVGGGAGNGTVDHVAGTNYAFGILYDRAASAVASFSNIDYVVGPWSATIADGAKGFGTINTPGDMQYVYGCAWQSANAEVTQAQIRSLLQALNWAVSW